MSVFVRRCEEGDEAKMATATAALMPHWPLTGLNDDGPKRIRQSDGALCVVRIDHELTESLAGDFAAHPSCAELGVVWFSDVASIVGYDEVED